jgi:hypothetical protein
VVAWGRAWFGAAVTQNDFFVFGDACLEDLDELGVALISAGYSAEFFTMRHA